MLMNQTIFYGILTLIFLNLGHEVFARQGDNSGTVTQVEGVYEVPVKTENPLLISAARFAVTYSVKTRPGRPTRISYDLPLALTGLPNDVELRQGVGAPTRWSGLNSEGTCEQFEENFVCTLTYKNLQLDERLGAELVRSQYPDPAVAAAKQNVAQLFRSEPIGVIRFPIELISPLGE